MVYLPITRSILGVTLSSLLAEFKSNGLTQTYPLFLENVCRLLRLKSVKNNTRSFI